MCVLSREEVHTNPQWQTSLIMVLNLVFFQPVVVLQFFSKLIATEVRAGSTSTSSSLTKAVKEEIIVAIAPFCTSHVSFEAFNSQFVFVQMLVAAIANTDSHAFQYIPTFILRKLAWHDTIIFYIDKKYRAMPCHAMPAQLQKRAGPAWHGTACIGHCLHCKSTRACAVAMPCHAMLAHFFGQCKHSIIVRPQIIWTTYPMQITY